jgi:hypothetical protein
METANRALVSAAAILVMAAALVLIAVAWDMVGPERIVSDGWLGDQLRDLDSLTGSDQSSAIAASAGAFVLAGLLLSLELATVRQGRVFTSDFDGNKFGITERSVKRLVQYAGEAVPGVRSIDPEIVRSGRGLEILCKATLDYSTEIQDLAPEIQNRVRNAVERMTGLSVSNVNVRLERVAPKSVSRVV